jgi:hypothetical protein
METIHQMLLQEWEGVLMLFPAVAQSWSDVVFEDLRVAGAFKVSATREGGHTTRVKVESEKGGTCRVQLPQGQWQCSIRNRHENILPPESLLEIESTHNGEKPSVLHGTAQALNKTPVLHDTWRVALPEGCSAFWINTNTVAPDVVTPAEC